jgi:hypothetical protein
LPFGIETDSLDTGVVPTWVWLVLLIVGLLLCFFGEIIWEFMVSILGAIIGSIIGYAVGMIIGGIFCAFGLMFIFAIIGSMLFRFLAKVAVALVCGLLAFGAGAYLTYLANPDDTTTPIIVGLIVGVIIFVIALMFVEEIVGVFLAAIGGIMITAALYFLIGGDSALILGAVAGIALFFIGAFVQVQMIGDKKRGRGGPPPQRAPPQEQQPGTSRVYPTPKTQQPPPKTPPTTPAHTPKPPTEPGI